MKADPTKELLAAMARFELDPGQIVWDGKKHRFPGPGKKSSNDDGWYIAFTDQFGAFFGDWARGIHEHWRLYNGKRPDDFDPAEWERMKQEMEQAAADRQIEQEIEWEDVAVTCTRRFEAAGPPRLDHPYLKAKGIETDLEGIKQDGNELLVPMKALEGGAISSLQRILPDGTKLFVEGGRTADTRTTIAAPSFPKDNTLYIAEGWATAWAIHQVTGSAAVVAFTCHNLEAVAVYHRREYPDAKIIVCADNDRWTHTYVDGKKVDNPGLVFAVKAAKAANAQLAVPDFKSLDGKPTDFHDLWQREGEEATREWLRPRRDVSTRPRPEKELPEQKRAEEPAPPGPDDDDDAWYEKAPFRCLGYDRGSYYYLPRESGQITSISTAGHDRKLFLGLAPLAWWQHTFPSDRGVNWTVAADALIRASHSAGVYKPEKIRGRGCWPDERGIILHLGDQLLPPGGTEYVDPESFTCSQRLIYERQPGMAGPSTERALELEETKSVLDLFMDLLWHEEASGHLLAGWTVLAPLCGSLTWRPHVWIMGGTGSGKSTVLKRVVRPLLGGMVCHVEGGTSEAGIRQRLQSDALPVVYDEAEKSDARSDAMVQRVVALARSASSTGSEILKGTTHGEALSFQNRSMFCLASIGGAVRQEADKTRISLLQLRGKSEVDPDERAEHWERYQQKLGQVFASDHRRQEQEAVGRQLVARTLGWLRDGRLRETLTTFQAAASAVLGDARAGDQYGTLYAGTWVLMADEPPQIEEAKALLRDSDISYYVSEHVPEGRKVLEALLQQRERVDTKNGAQTLAVGQLIDAARGNSALLTDVDANNALRQFGLRVDVHHGQPVLYVANTSDWITKALKDTPYSDNHRGALRTLRGVEAGGQVRFHGGLNSRTTIVPIDVLEE